MDKRQFLKFCWENWTDTCKIVKLDYFLKPHTKINKKMYYRLNVRPQTIKLLTKRRPYTLLHQS